MKQRDALLLADIFISVVPTVLKNTALYNRAMSFAAVNEMSIAIAMLLLLCLCLLLAWGLISLVQSLTDKSPFDEPAFREPGPIFHEHTVEQQGARSQFAWQSRSHSKAPD